ncbi:primosomal protein N' [Mariniluteicoccus endophyticus]
MVEALIPLEPVRVARVAVEVALPHLDRLFDYEVPDDLDVAAQPGTRVRVRFAGRTVDGFVVERAEVTDPEHSLSRLEKVVSPEQVLTPEVVALVRAVADHYAGVFADVVRLAVPPRHAATEKDEHPDHPAPAAALPQTSPWDDYPTGSALVSALAEGGSPRAAWQVVPTAGRAGDWATGLAVAALATIHSGRGALLLVPDARDLARLQSACDEVVGVGAYAVLSADLGPAARYRAFLAALRGDVRLVIGTRAAAYAPVRDLGLVAIVDDGDDLYADPHAPYPHAREVLGLRAQQAGAAMITAAHARSCEVQNLIDHGWLRPLGLGPPDARLVAPAVRIAADSDWSLERDPLARSVRIPRELFPVMRGGLAQGPVLVQVPRAGYLVVLTCQTCREPVRCPHCGGPVRAGTDRVTCGWCARPVVSWRCDECGGSRWRAPVVGAERTAEELGRAFPGTKVVASQGNRIVDVVGPEPALVIATAGGEPRAEGGYAAAVLLDTEQLLTRLDLRAAEEAFRRWSNAAALVRPASEGGTVVAVGSTQAVPLQALVRLDPAGFAFRELTERRETHLPPAARMVTVEGDHAALDEFLALAELPEHCEVLGPVDVPRPGDVPLGRVTLRAPRAETKALIKGVRGAVGVRSARKSEGALRVRVDPVVLGW